MRKVESCVDICCECDDVLMNLDMNVLLLSDISIGPCYSTGPLKNEYH